MSGTLKGALAALLSMAIFATHDVAAKLLGQDFHAVQIVFFAALFSFPLISVVLIHDRNGGSLRPVHPGWVALRTACVLTTGLAAFHAFAVLPLAQVYAILFASPLLITLLAIPMLGERVGPHRLAAVVVGLVGVLIVLRPGHVDLSMGHASALLAAATGATGAVISRKIGKVERAAVLLLFPMLGNVVVMGALLPLVYRPMRVEHLALEALIAESGMTSWVWDVREGAMPSLPI